MIAAFEKASLPEDAEDDVYCEGYVAPIVQMDTQPDAPLPPPLPQLFVDETFGEQVMPPLRIKTEPAFVLEK